MAKKITADLSERGQTGLRATRGTVAEEFLWELRGPRGMKRIRQMVDNDATVGAVLFGMEMLLRSVEWSTRAADQSNAAADIAEKAESLRHDMSMPWEHVISEALTMVPYGWAFQEIVYKVRTTELNDKGVPASKYDDGLIGWRKLPIRSQDTLDKWEFDAEGGIAGMWQKPPEGAGAGKSVLLPIEKAVLFRTTARKNNPEGRSALRNAYRSWHYKTNIEEIEAIGIDRDLAGIPAIGVPAEVLTDPQHAAVKAAFEKMGENIRNDEQAYVMYPLEYDDHGNQLYKVELMSATGQKQFDTDKVLGRYAREIATVTLMDIILLGHQKVGSYSLSDTKDEMLRHAMQSWLGEIAAVFNMHALPRWMALNALPPELTPEYVPGEIRPATIAELGEFFRAMAQAGYPLFPDELTETWIAEQVGFPRGTAQDRDVPMPDDDVPAPEPEPELDEEE